MQKHKIYMVAGSDGYASWFPLPYQITRDYKEADTIIFEGGPDLSPWSYGEKKGSHTYADDALTRTYLKAWDYFKDKKVLKIGTCLGHQALCCFNFPGKAKLIQHINHPSRHPVITKEGKELESNSCHHQMALLDERYTGLKEGADYELISHSNKTSSFHLNGEDEDYAFPDDYKEVEAVWIDKTLSFCSQNHLEWMPSNAPLVKYSQELLVEKMKQHNLL